MKPRIDFFKVAYPVVEAMLSLGKYLNQSAIEEPLRNLVYLRASQVNGCAYCIDMHWKDLRAAGETEQRLYGLDAWEESQYYSERERAIGLDGGGNKSHGRPPFGRGVRESTKAPDGKRTGRPDVGHCGDQRMESAQRCCANGARSISAAETARTAKKSISNNIRRLTIRELWNRGQL
jgi:AhpD family alkylhydroperoxidase